MEDAVALDRLRPHHEMRGWKRLRFRGLVATAAFSGVVGRAFRRAGLGDPGVRLLQFAAITVPPAAAMTIVGASLALAIGTSLIWFLLLWTFFKFGLHNKAEAGAWAIIFYIVTAVPMVLFLTSIVKWAT